MKSASAVLVWFIVLSAFCSAHAVTWHVPSQCPTIQAGIDSASAGDTVEVACGTYIESGIDVKSGVHLRSETGLADCVTIEPFYGRILLCYEDSLASLTGFTLARVGLGGRAGQNVGAAMTCEYSSLSISNCDFVENFAPIAGGGALFWYSDVSLDGCRFVDNVGNFSGGGVESRGSTLTFSRCSFERNTANIAAALYAEDSVVDFVECAFTLNYAYRSYYAGTGSAFILGGGGPSSMTGCTIAGNVVEGQCAVWVGDTELDVRDCVFAFNTGDGPVVCCTDLLIPTLSCCDIYGNQGGDWVGPIEDQYGINGNFSACPLFCDPENRDFRLQLCSPCAPGNHPAGYDCGLIGAFGIGCECGLPSRVQPSTWSSLKALYR